jgi:hypothetical protein
MLKTQKIPRKERVMRVREREPNELNVFVVLSPPSKSKIE